MSDAPLEVRLQVTKPSDFAAGRTDKPVTERRNPTKVAVYKGDGIIDVILDPAINLSTQLVQVGSKMDQWTSQQMTEEAITYAAAQVRLLAKGAPVNVSCPDQYKAVFEAAYAKS